MVPRKATIDFHESPDRRLEMAAARRGRTVRELVAEGVRYALAAQTAEGESADGDVAARIRQLEANRTTP